MLGNRLPPRPADAGRAPVSPWRGRLMLLACVIVFALLGALYLQDSTGRARAYGDRAGQLYDKGEYAAAIADYTEAVKLDPGNVRWYVARALAYYENGDDAHTVTDATEALHRDPQNAEAYLNRGRAYDRMGDTARAKADYDQIL